MLQRRMVDHFAKSLNPQISVPYGLVPVFMAFKRIFGVVEVYGLKSFQSYNFVKMFQHPVQVVYNIIAGIENMAGIQADTQTVPDFYPVHNLL